MKTSTSYGINELRQKRWYRVLESLLGVTTIGAFIIIIIASIVAPVATALLVILYNLYWLFRLSLIFNYTIFTYKNLLRWESVNSWELVQNISSSVDSGIKKLLEIRNRDKGKIAWSDRINGHIAELESVRGTKYAKPADIFHFPIYSVYNEPFEVLERSLESIYKASYDKSKIVVFITQEERVGEEFNNDIQSKINELEWSNMNVVQESDLSIVYGSEHVELEYKNKEFKRLKLSEKKLNIVVVQHPDGLEGEIKGKASNEDWAARQISLFAKARGVDAEMSLVTSLDADSSVSPSYFSLLSLHYAVTPDRHERGFQPLPAYTNNFFECGVFNRLVSAQSTLWQLSQNNLTNKAVFYANYAVSLDLAQRVGFWERELIAEDFLFYAKCSAHFDGRFRVVPFYGMFIGDTVDGDDSVQNIENQYKQLQRWTWGGVESFPYAFKKFFVDENKTDFRRKFEIVSDVFMIHHWWAVAPFIFSVGVAAPRFFGGPVFEQSYAASNVAIFSQFFFILSTVFIMIYGYVTFSMIIRTVEKIDRLNFGQSLMVLGQMALMPIMFIIGGIPAIDSQIRGIRGKYLGYWVTPKK